MNVSKQKVSVCAERGVSHAFLCVIDFSAETFFAAINATVKWSSG